MPPFPHTHTILLQPPAPRWCPWCTSGEVPAHDGLQPSLQGSSSQCTSGNSWPTPALAPTPQPKQLGSCSLYRETPNKDMPLRPGEVTVLTNSWTQTQKVKLNEKVEEYMFQMKKKKNEKR